MKIRKIIYLDGTFHWWYNCPGCGYEHAFKTHEFNGDQNNPTVRPSLLQDNPQNHHRCHSFITDGKISFCSDCWHELKNQTVDLPDYPEGKGDVDMTKGEEP